MKRVALIALAVLALAAPLAYATTLRDRDDVTTGFDISKTAGSHNRASDELVHTIDFFDAIPHPLTTPPSSVCVEIWTRSTPRESPADYEACATAVKGGEWKGSIARKRDRGAGLRVGAVKVEKPTDTRLVLRIDPDLIKRPSSYRWRSESTSFAKDCTRSTGCPDYAPDRPATAATSLSAPR